jgi:hypothetical protein
MTFPFIQQPNFAIIGVQQVCIWQKNIGEKSRQVI